MRQVDVIILPQSAGEDYFQNKQVVVIDVLRACTSIATAFAHGASALYACQRPDDVRQLAERMKEDAPLLCGEREGLALPGFDLANSPLEYTPQRVQNKVLLYTSSNGSQMMVKARLAAGIVLGSFVNLAAVVHWLTGKTEDVCIACSGREGHFSLEDTVCAGMMVHALSGNSKLTDAAHAACVLFQHHAKDIHAMLQQSQHGQYLISLKLEEDLAFAAQVDRYDCVPQYNGTYFELK